MYGSRVGALLLVFLATAMPAVPARAQVPEVTPTWQQEVDVSQCGDMQDARGYVLDARPGAGALVHLYHRLAAYTPQGGLRWQASADCTDPRPGYWESAILTPDGGAWAVEVDSADGSRSLRRFDARGLEIASVDLEVGYEG